MLSVSAIFPAGAKFGRWTVLREAPRYSNKGRRLWCRCDCGTERVVAIGSLKRGLSTSCGCFLAEWTAAKSTKHGSAGRGQKTREYVCWESMRRRCRRPKDKSYPRYGGRGIAVCERWDSFENFLTDMGAKPGPEYSIDRIDPNGNYEPSNCRWSTVATQANNQRSNRLIEFRGERLTLMEWSRRTGINRSTITRRLDLGWSVEDALTQSPDPAPLFARAGAVDDAVHTAAAMDAGKAP